MFSALILAAATWVPSYSTKSGSVIWTNHSQLVSCPAGVRPPSNQCAVIADPAKQGAK